MYTQVVLDKLNLLRLCGVKTIVMVFILEWAEYQLLGDLLYDSMLCLFMEIRDCEQLNILPHYCAAVNCSSNVIRVFCLFFTPHFLLHVQCLLFLSVVLVTINHCQQPLTSTWPHLRCDVGLEERKY